MITGSYNKSTYKRFIDSEYNEKTISFTKTCVFFISKKKFSIG